MSILTMKQIEEFFFISTSRNDLKELKKHGVKGLDTGFENIDVTESTFSLNIQTTITNTINALTKSHFKYGKQPFLTQGIELYKLYWGIDNKGAQAGLRIIYCLIGSSAYLIYIKKKKDNEKESDLYNEVKRRVKNTLL